MFLNGVTFASYDPSESWLDLINPLLMGAVVIDDVRDSLSPVGVADAGIPITCLGIVKLELSELWLPNHSFSFESVSLIILTYVF